jgi:Protein of unknown function (DUF3071)
MKDLRVVGRTEDGTQIELADGDGQTFFVRISDNLKALVNQPRLVSVTPYEDRATYSVKEIQSRLRSGESAAAISTTTDWSLEKIEKFSGPIMQERAYVIGLALQTQLRRDSSAPTLATATIAQLQPRGVDMSEVDWNTHRNDDATWTIVLQYPTSDGRGSAEANWIFDSDNRTLVADDDGARWISGDEKPLRPNTPSHGMVFGGEQSAPAPRLTAYSESVTVIENVSLSVVPDHEVSEDKDEDQEIQETPTESIPSDAKKDGVTKRIRIPSWDDIMFGTKKDEPTE